VVRVVADHESVEVAIDGSRCLGHARCYALAPEVFDVDEVDGKAMSLLNPVPSDLAELAREGADACPERAISIRTIE
jgi:ferredoxin